MIDGDDDDDGDDDGDDDDDYDDDDGLICSFANRVYTHS